MIGCGRVKMATRSWKSERGQGERESGRITGCTRYEE